jgi:hypothetical protein
MRTGWADVGIQGGCDQMTIGPADHPTDPSVHRGLLVLAAKVKERSVDPNKPRRTHTSADDKPLIEEYVHS